MLQPFNSLSSWVWLVWTNYDSYVMLQVALLSSCGIYVLLQLYPRFLHISQRSLRGGGPLSGPSGLCSGLRVCRRTMMWHVMHSWPIPTQLFLLDHVRPHFGHLYSPNFLFWRNEVDMVYQNIFCVCEVVIWINLLMHSCCIISSCPVLYFQTACMWHLSLYLVLGENVVLHVAKA